MSWFEILSRAVRLANRINGKKSKLRGLNVKLLFFLQSQAALHFQIYLVLLSALSTCSPATIRFITSKSRPISDYLKINIGQTLQLECAVSDDTVGGIDIITPYHYHFSDTWRDIAAKSTMPVRSVIF